MNPPMDPYGLIDWLLWSNLRVALLVVAAVIVLAIARSLPSSARSALWFTVVATCVAVPLLTALLPVLAVPVLPADPLPTDTVYLAPIGLPPVDSVVAASNGPDAATWLVALYGLGSLSVFATFFMALWRVRRLQRAMTPASDARLARIANELRNAASIRRPVMLATSDGIDTPMTWGWLRPAVLLPTAALTWPEHQLRNALIHELGHVRRQDWARLWLLKSAAAAYWFNPMVWLAIRQCMFEAERACDDLVLLAGGRSSDYAEQLVDIMARQRAGTLSAAGLALGERAFVRRVRAILDYSVQEFPMKRMKLRLLQIAVVLAALILSAGRLTTAQDAQSAPDLRAPAPLPALNVPTTPVEVAVPAPAPSLEQQSTIAELARRLERLEQTLRDLQAVPSDPDGQAALERAADREGQRAAREAERALLDSRRAELQAEYAEQVMVEVAKAEQVRRELLAQEQAARVEAEVARQNLDELDARNRAARSRVESLNRSRVEAAPRDREEVVFLEQAYRASKATYDADLARREALEVERRNALQRYTEDSPAISEIESELEAVRAQLVDDERELLDVERSLRERKAAEASTRVNAELERVRVQEAALSAELNTVRGRLAELERQLRQLQ